jgi:hypothetical protein
MKKTLSLKCSSFTYDTDIYIPDDFAPATPVTTGWRALSTSCVLKDGKRTGYARVETLEQYILATGVANGVTKLNVPSDPDYITDYLDPIGCKPIPTNANIFVVNRLNFHSVTVRAVNSSTSETKTFNVGSNSSDAVTVLTEPHNITVTRNSSSASQPWYKINNEPPQQFSSNFSFNGTAPIKIVIADTPELTNMPDGVS